MQTTNDLKSGLLDSRDSFLEKPGDYTHGDFDLTDQGSVQGLVFMPIPGWSNAHAVLAVQLALVAIAQFVVGVYVYNFDSFQGL